MTVGMGAGIGRCSECLSEGTRSIDLGICAVGAYDRVTWHAAQPVPQPAQFLSLLDEDDDLAFWER